MRSDDEMARRTEVVIHAAHVGHQEAIGVFEFFSAWKEQTRDNAVAERLAGKFHLGEVGTTAHAGCEFPRVVIPKPALVNENRVRAIQEIFQAVVHSRGGAGFHSKRGPRGLPSMCKTIWVNLVSGL